MKNLRHMLRTRWFGSRKNKRKESRGQRRLNTQTLEKRNLLAGDILQNGWAPADVTDDGEITARDALVAMNHLNQISASGEAVDTEGMFLDVNGDGVLTAADPLRVINRLNEGAEQVGEVIELLLSARDLNDNPLPVTSGEVNVDVGEQFFLEVAYNDLRMFGADIGAFQLFTDLTTSTGGVLQPVLNETQRLTFDGALRTATGGSYTFSLEGSSTEYISQFADFANDPRAEIVNALTAFGYASNQYTISSLDFGNDDLGFQIRYTDSAFGNMDLPDISVADNLENIASAPVTFTEFAPFNPDGSVNSAAVRFNLNTFSRTFNSNSSFYGSLNRGSFDDATGFTEVGGVGGVPTDGGGIPELSVDNDLLEPFDAFSLRVFLDEPVSDFVVSVAPTNVAESVLLYGRDDAVPSDMVLIDADASVTFNATSTGTNSPDAGAPITRTLSENDASISLNVLDQATDADGDTVTLQGAIVARAGSDTSGITINGSSITVDPSAYAALNTGQSEVVILDYTVTDGGLTDTNTVTITINGVTANQPPTSTAVTGTFAETQVGTVNVDLVANASDPDGDPINVVTGSVSLVSGSATGIVINEANNRLEVTPSAYSLNSGQSEVVTYTYTITDGVNAAVANTATITITGASDPPVLSGPVTASFTEDDATGSVDLLTNATDPENDTLSVSNVTVSSGDATGITLSGNSLTVQPSAYNALSVGDSEVVQYTYNVTDGPNSVAQTATITISGVNDAPVVSGPVAQTFNVNDSAGSVNLLGNASDPDANDSISASGVTLSGNTVGVGINGNSLSVDPSQYSLASGASTTVTATYNIVDGNGGSVATMATVTITNSNRSPVLGTSPLSFTYAEDAGTQTISLIQDASDPDGDTLGINSFTGTANGFTRAGTQLTVDPSVYSNLDNGQFEDFSFTYNVVDGNGGVTAQSLNVRITGVTVVGNAPVVSQPISQSISEDAATATYDLLQFASDADGDTLGVVSSSVNITNDPSGAVTVNGNDLTIDPSLYGSLNAGQSQVITVQYNITDGNQSVQQTATITVVGANDGTNPPTTISGDLFVDKRTPTRNGVMDAGEAGLGGVVVRLTSAAADNSTGVAVDRVVLTDLNGHYSFEGVQPGTYEVTYEVPDNVQYVGSNTSEVVASASGGTVAGANFVTLGLSGALNNSDVHVLNHLTRNGVVSDMSNGGREGGSVALDENGIQALLIAGEGYDGVRFAELALNQAQDAALLTVLLENGTVQTAQLSSDFFMVSRDGSSVQFFGGLDDFDFAPSATDLLQQEFIGYRDAIDRVLAGG